MNFVILDLEWNGSYSKKLKQYINEVIQFGAVKVTEDLTVIDTFDTFVKPQVGKAISEKVETLTNITNEDLQAGLQFMQAVSRFRKWMGDGILLTWGTSDILVLIQNCRYFCGNERIPFLDQYIDLQHYCEDCLNYEKGKQMGLSTAAQLLEIDEEGVDHHRALDDSMLSLACLRKIYQKERLMALCQDAKSQEFYDRMQFKTVIICDLKNPLIKRSDLIFHCPNCGKRAKRKEQWVLKNKSYRAPFICQACGNHFLGRVQFKLKYEGLIAKKAVLPIEEEQAAPKKE